MRRIFLLFSLFSLFSTAVYADDQVIAKVNGAVITAQDVENELDILMPRATFHGGASSASRLKLRSKAIENLIVQQLQYQDAIERGLKPDKKRVKARMSEIRDRFPSKAKYKEALKQVGVSEDDLRAKVEREILIQTVTDKMVTEPARMSDDAVREYYDKNTAKFKQPERIKLWQITAKDKKKIDKAHSRLQSGEDFSAVASTSSEDDYRVKGGDMGYIHRGRLKIPDIENAAFRLKTGETSRPLHVEGVWYILKVEDKKPERQVSFDEIREKLKIMLESRRSAELMEQWMSGLRAKAKIETFEKEGGKQ